MVPLENASLQPRFNSSFDHTSTMVEGIRTHQKSLSTDVSVVTLTEGVCQSL